MNKQKLSEMQYARVKVRPMALDSSTGEWRYVDTAPSSIEFA